MHKTYDLVVASIAEELRRQSNFLVDKRLSSIYFGGGTPSLLKGTDLKSILTEVNNLFDVAGDAEITLEANPDDLTLDKLEEIQYAGVNRLSIGIQSFFDEHLQAMNRSHEAQQAIQCVKDAQHIGFKNITIDLIFGLPSLTIEQWRENIEQAIALEVPHISAYSLTVEARTALQKMVESGQVIIPPDQEVLEQYKALTHLLRKNGYEHYELSNYGKPGFHSKHNTSYWAGDHYLGIGPSAHSFNGEYRQWNIANNSRYCAMVERGETWFEREELTLEDQFNEYIMTGLRTANGVSLVEIENRFSRSDALLNDAQGKLECGKLELRKTNLIIPESEWMMSDQL